MQCLVLLVGLDNEDDIFVAVRDLIMAIENDLEKRMAQGKVDHRF